MNHFEPRVVNTGDPDVIAWDFANGDNHVRQLLSAAQTASQLSFFESVLAPGFVVNAHIHRDEDEYWYVMDSGLEALVGDRRVTVSAGSIVAIPSGTLHELRNVGSTPVRSIFFSIPGGLEHFFSGMDELLQSGAEPSAFAALFERTGTTFPSRR